MAWITAHAGMIGLLFFFTFFMALVLWLLQPGMKDKARDHARIPLEEDKING
ncbi:MAG: cbb3-type cytochrome c oxidase subunit 3 [Rhodospirillales bacterium]|nr:cbb3-type cytochrome c oxidase subunit 3 [Rhodospirillales bacterium]